MFASTAALAHPFTAAVTTPALAATHGRPDVAFPLTVTLVLAVLYVALTVVRPVARLLARITRLSFSIGTLAVAALFLGILATGGLVLAVLRSVFPTG